MKNTFSISKFFFVLRFAMLFLLLFASCARKQNTAHKSASMPKPARLGWKQQGIASWYGDPYHGRRAANGEVYDMEAFTAAHKTLPFETWVRVRDLSNKKQTEVRITDRGPFVEGRILDLSKAAAREIDLLGPGISRVKIEVIRSPKMARNPAPNFVAPKFSLQIAAVNDKQVAQRISKHASRFGSSRIVLKPASSPPVYRVLVEADSGQIPRELLERVRSEFTDAFLTRVD